MIPSNKWFPSSLQERAAWFDNFATQMANIGANLGFTAPEISAIGADNTMMQFLANTTVTLEAYKDAVRQFRVITTEGDIGDPPPLFPADLNFIAPPSAPGLFERLDDNVKRIRTAPNYTDESGALLGIIPQPQSSSSPASALDQMQPTLKAISLPGSVVQVSFVRGQTDGVAVETRIDNGAEWADAGRFFKSPASLVIPENPQNLPRAVQVRARYVDGNTPFGQFSPIVSLATQPEG